MEERIGKIKVEYLMVPCIWNKRQHRLMEEVLKNPIMVPGIKFHGRMENELALLVLETRIGHVTS